VASIQLSGDTEADTVETELLFDIRSAFEARRRAANTKTALDLADRFPSDELVAFLVALEDRPWAEINKGRPLTKNGLASRLKEFQIRPGTIQLSKGRGARTAKGYYRKAFEDAFERYLPPLPPETADSNRQTVRHGRNPEVSDHSEPSDRTMSDGSEIPENTSISAMSDGLTFQNAENGGGSLEGHAGRVPNGDAKPNGDVALNGKRLTQLQREIIAYDKGNPGQPLAQIAKHFGRPQKEVVDLLGRPT
jgi:hypothetical protein